MRRTERAGGTLGPVARGILFAASLVVAAACEHPGVPHALATAEHDSTALSLFADAVGGFATAGSGGAAEGGAELSATIRFKDFQLDPDSVKVAAGTVRFTLVNEGRYTHDFRIEGNGVDDKSPRIGAGRTIEWSITLQPGEYKISCPVSNHADRGMTGTLAVVGQ